MNEKIEEEEEIRISDVVTITKVKALQKHIQRHIKENKATKKQVVQKCIDLVYDIFDAEEQINAEEQIKNDKER